jgi:K+-sensing histidine kinase KdpD
MNDVKKQSIRTHNIVKASMLLAVVIVVQTVGRSVPQVNQFFVGPVVNAILLITVYTCSTKWGSIAAVLTPILAYLVGQLLPLMAPFIPFIMLGNLVYVLIFGLLKNNKYGIYIGVLLAAFVKYLVLSFAATKLIYWFGIGFPEQVAKKLGQMMGLTQFVTGNKHKTSITILIRKMSKHIFIFLIPCS